MVGQSVPVIGSDGEVPGSKRWRQSAAKSLRRKAGEHVGGPASTGQQADGHGQVQSSSLR